MALFTAWWSLPPSVGKQIFGHCPVPYPERGNSFVFHGSEMGKGPSWLHLGMGATLVGPPLESRVTWGEWRRKFSIPEKICGHGDQPARKADIFGPTSAPFIAACWYKITCTPDVLFMVPCWYKMWRLLCGLKPRTKVFLGC